MSDLQRRIAERAEIYKERLLSRREIDSNGCWNYTRAKHGDGYGICFVLDQNIYAHRLSYLLFKGSIEDGLQIDHLCRNLPCFNPDHLELVTVKENVLRGVGATAINAKKTHCPNGHLLEGKRGKKRVIRYCLICTNARRREVTAMKRAGTYVRSTEKNS